MNARGDPLAHMTTEQRETYAERLEAMAFKKRGRVADFIRAAARVAKPGQFYGAEFAA